MQPNNMFVITGRLVRDPKVYDNKDGSKKIQVTVATSDNFKSKNGARNQDGTTQPGYGAQFVSAEAYVNAATASKKGIGVYGLMQKGTMVSLGGTIKSSSYEKDGQTVYTQTLNIDSVTLMGRAKNAGGAAAATAETTTEPAVAAQPADAGAVGDDFDDEDMPFGDEA